MKLKFTKDCPAAWRAIHILAFQPNRGGTAELLGDRAHRDGAASLNNSDSEIEFSEGPFARLSYIGSRIVDSR